MKLIVSYVIRWPHGNNVKSVKHVGISMRVYVSIL
jgi:hypothetical protein